MNTVVDTSMVACVLCAAGCYAFLSLAPRAWRIGALNYLGALTDAVPGLGGASRRLKAAAARLAVSGGCGGCGSCSPEPGKPAATSTDIHIPLSSIKRRR